MTEDDVALQYLNNIVKRAIFVTTGMPLMNKSACQ